MTTELLWERYTPYEPSTKMYSCGWSYLLRQEESAITYAFDLSAEVHMKADEPSDIFFSVRMMSDCCNDYLRVDAIGREKIAYRCSKCEKIPAHAGGLLPTYDLVGMGARAFELPIKDVSLALNENSEQEFYEGYGYDGLLYGAELVNTVERMLTDPTALWNNHKVLYSWVQQTMEEP